MVWSPRVRPSWTQTSFHRAQVGVAARSSFLPVPHWPLAARGLLCTQGRPQVRLRLPAPVQGAPRREAAGKPEPRAWVQVPN